MCIIVKNLREEPKPPECGCGTWIRHWENNKNEKRGKCCALSCFEKADRGGHVQRKDINDNSWNIIPICAKHNAQFGEEFSIDDEKYLVLAGKTSYCKP